MKEKSYSQIIANGIKSFLEEDDWHFSFDEQRGLFEFGLSLKGKLKKINYIVKVKEADYVVYAVSPIGADADDEKAMLNMADFVCRANYGLVNGNFELDMSDGEVRFKCFVDCDGITPTKEMVRNSIYCPYAMFKRYGAGVIDIIYGNAPAKEAIERCEKATEDELRTLLSELFDVEESCELDELIEKMVDRPDSANEEKNTEVESKPIHLKTNLFGTEGADA